MRFHILTLFPDMVRQGLETSIIGRAVDKGLIGLNMINIRDFTREKHGRVDDYTYGGGAGMLMQAQPVFDAWSSVCGSRPLRTIYVTPQGEPFTQKKARELAKEEELIILCGHYEGIDERVLEETVTDRISIGDYILTGGELAAMVIVDAVGRLVPGVLGNETSADTESFHGDLLEYPQYSRPEVWHGKRVPEVLLSGDHRRVDQWRMERARERTAAARPDLYQRYEEKQALIKKLSKDKRNHIHIMESLERGRGEVLYRQGEQLLVADREAKTCMLLDGIGGRTGNAVTLSVESGRRLEQLLSAAPEQTEWFVVIQEGLVKEMLERGFCVRGKCGQYLYTSGQTLPVRHRDIRRLTPADLDYVSSHYRQETKKYLEACIQAGVMYGAFEDGRQLGFIGTHSEGSMGMLYVEEEYRRQGVGRALLSYNINRILEQGRIPYGHVPAGNTASERLMEKTGLYRAGLPVWWMQKKACNHCPVVVKSDCCENEDGPLLQELY